MGIAFNAMLSQGVADAVGADFEFGDPQPKKVLEVIEGRKPLLITDDTQMALFGMQALTEIESKNIPASKCLPVLVKHYVDWWYTQTAPQKCVTDLGKNKFMHRQRAPGRTCMNALDHWVEFNEQPENTSLGCGTVMRLLPFALYAQKRPKKALELAHMASAITHGHPKISATTSLYMSVAAQLIAGQGLDSREWEEDPRVYGQGWDAVSCLNMALSCVAHSKSYKRLLLSSICHPGDSDSVAAVAGGLWSLAGGEFPGSMWGRLQEFTVIDRVVAEFEKICDFS